MRLCGPGPKGAAGNLENRLLAGCVRIEAGAGGVVAHQRHHDRAVRRDGKVGDHRIARVGIAAQIGHGSLSAIGLVMVKLKLLTALAFGLR